MEENCGPLSHFDLRGRCDGHEDYEEVQNNFNEPPSLALATLAHAALQRLANCHALVAARLGVVVSHPWGRRCCGMQRSRAGRLLRGCVRRSIGSGEAWRPLQEEDTRMTFFPLVTAGAC